MADIVSPEAIKFSNEVVRPISEEFRLLKAKVDCIMASWNGGKNILFPVDAAAIVQDGRGSAGDTRLSGNDIVLSVVQFQAFQTQLNQPGVMAVINKPCVRQIL